MNTLKFLLLSFFILNFAKAQDAIVPIPIENNWPLSSAILDSVEYFTAKNIADNKVSRCDIYNDKGELSEQLFYDRDGRLISKQYIRKNELSYEVKYTRNAQGQIIEEAHISYNPKEGVKISTDKYDYLNNKPLKAFLNWNSRSEIKQEAFYSGDSLSAFGYILGEEYKNNKPQKIIRIKDSSGFYTFIGDDKKHSLFESANMDSVVAGDFTRTFYSIKDHKIIFYAHNGVDYYRSYLFHYDKNGLISYTENEFRDLSIHKSKSYYKYYYYEE